MSIKDENVQLPRGIVRLEAFDRHEQSVFRQELSVDEYYDQLHPLLDGPGQYRARLQIRALVGAIYNYDGQLDQEFRNEYDEGGKILKGKITFADGTIVES